MENEEKNEVAGAETSEETAEETSGAAEERDFRAEVEELGRLYPELMSGDAAVPGEVARECLSGKRLAEAYAEYDAARRRKEESILRQNAEAAGRAPVTGAAGAVLPEGEKDDFIRALELA